MAQNVEAFIIIFNVIIIYEENVRPNGHFLLSHDFFFP